VCDYGVLLKLDKGDDILDGQIRLLKVFTLIGGRSCSEYIRALTVNVLLWSHWERTDHPCWKIFVQNASAFNEESGELAFSCLARTLSTGGGTRLECPAVSRLFFLMKSKMEIAADLNFDLGCDDFGKSKGRLVRQSSSDVTATAAHFQTVIRHILARRFRHYDQNCGHLDKKDAKKARPTIAMDHVPEIFRKTAQSFQDNVCSARNAICQLWVQDHKDVWPEAIPALNFESAEENELSSGGSDASPQPSEDDDSKRGDGQLVGGGRKRKERVTPEDSREVDKKRRLSPSELIGRTVAVPGSQFGMQWCKENYNDHKNAIIHGVLTELVHQGKKVVFRCKMVECSADYLFKVPDVQRWLLSVEDAKLAVDSKMKD
jgi:hypothetical protein